VHFYGQQAKPLRPLGTAALLYADCFSAMRLSAIPRLRQWRKAHCGGYQARGFAALRISLTADTSCIKKPL
jgi:hypothetical protein